jgi:signal transduction histidine kinase
MLRRRLSAAALAAGAALWLVGWIGVTLGVEVAYHVENVGWVVVAAAAAASAFAAALDPAERRARLSFLCLGAGCLSWALGQLGWTYYVLRGIEVPYPSLSDLGYLTAMPFLALCVLAWPRRRRVWTAGAVVDGTLAVGAVAVLLYTLSFDPILSAGVNGAEAWLGITYPAVELALVGLVGAGLLLDGWADRGRLAAIATGLLALGAVDTVFAVDAVDGSLTAAFDAAWTVAFVALGTAAILPKGWPSSSRLRIPDFLPPVVVTALLGLAAGAFALRSLHEERGVALDELAIGALLLLAAARVLVVTRSQSRQNAMLAAAEGELRSAQASRDRFLVELVSAQEHGSRRIADLLHDDVVQQLTALGFRLELEAQRSEQPRLRELAADTGRITASIRRLLIELHPAILDSQGLGPAVDVVAEGLRERGIDVRVAPFPHRLPRETETLAYRLVQEGLASVLSHSGASTAEVDLRLHDGVLRGRVSDSGSGLRPAEHTVDGFGLLVARERVELAGGRFLVETSAEGTDFLFDLPVATGEERQEVAS